MRRLNEHDPLSRNIGAISYGISTQNATALQVPDPAEQIRTSRLKAEKEGHEEGLSKGLADAKKQIDARVKVIEGDLRREHEDAMKALEETKSAFARLLKSLHAQGEQLVSLSEEVAVEAAYAAVLKVLGNHAADGNLMREICLQAIASAEEAPTVLRVSNEDFSILGDEWKDVVLIADPRLSSGQCALETRLGHYETGVDVRLEAIKNAFLEGLQRYRNVVA